MNAAPGKRLDLVRRIQQASVPILPKPTGLSPRLTSLDGIRAILFDIYGTLLVSAAGDVGTLLDKQPAALMESSFLAAGYRLVPGTGGAVGERYTATIKAAHLARRERGAIYPEIDIIEIWRQIVSALLQEKLVEGSLETECLQTLALEYELRQNPVWPMPAAGTILGTLRQRGLILGLVSNAQFYTPLILEALVGEETEASGFPPDLCFYSWLHGEAKPSPLLWRCAVNSLTKNYHVPPEAILAVGNDAENDIRPPRDLGCRTALFAGDARSLRFCRDDGSDGGTDLILTDLGQLCSVLPP